MAARDNPLYWRPSIPHAVIAVKQRSRQIKRILRIVLKSLMALLLASAVLVFTLRFVNPPTWAWKIHRDLFPPRGYPQRIHHSWIAGDRIAPAMRLAVIAAEDQRFPEHFGFDFTAIASALEHNDHSRRIRGASTLSQQTAKNLFLWPSRTYLRKGVEAWFTLLLELLWSKQRILEVYLNVVEFGPGIYGVDAASRAYFHHSARSLDWTEAARLAAVLPNPYHYRANPPTPYVLERSEWIVEQMGQLGMATVRQL